MVKLATKETPPGNDRTTKKKRRSTEPNTLRNCVVALRQPARKIHSAAVVKRTPTKGGNDARDEGTTRYGRKPSASRPVDPPPKPPRGNQNAEQLYWSTKTEMLSIIEEDLKLKLEIREIKEQFLNLLLDFDQFSLPTTNTHDSQQRHLEVQHPPTHRRKSRLSDSLSISSPDATGALSNKHAADPDATKPSSEDTQSTSLTSATHITTSSYGDLTAPNQTTASEPQSNLDDIFINEISSRDLLIEEEKTSNPGCSMRRKSQPHLIRHPQDARYSNQDTSSDSSYNKPYPTTKPELHPSLKKNRMRPHPSVDKSLGDVSDITRASDQSSRWFGSQQDLLDDTNNNFEGKGECEAVDGNGERKMAPQQSTPTNAQKDGVSQTRQYEPRNNKDPHHNVDPSSTSALSSLDESTPVPRARRPLFPHDSGITGSNSDYTSSPSTLREHTTTQSPNLFGRNLFRTLTPSGTNTNGNLETKQYEDRFKPSSFLPLRHDLSIAGQNTDDPNVIKNQPDHVAQIEESGITEESMLTRPASRAAQINSQIFNSLLSPTTSFATTGLNYDRESEGDSLFENPKQWQRNFHNDLSISETNHLVAKQWPPDINSDPNDSDVHYLGARPEMIGKEASIWFPQPNTSLTGSAHEASYEEILDTPKAPIEREIRGVAAIITNRRPPCIGKEATPLMRPTTGAVANGNGNQSPRDAHKMHASFTFPSPSFTEDQENQPVQVHEGVFAGNCDYPKEEEITKQQARREEPLQEIKLVDYIDVDQYIQGKGDKKKTLLKRLKGFGKHFRVNSRSKRAKGQNECSKGQNQPQPEK